MLASLSTNGEASIFIYDNMKYFMQQAMCSIYHERGPREGWKKKAKEFRHKAVALGTMEYFAIKGFCAAASSQLLPKVF